MLLQSKSSSVQNASGTLLKRQNRYEGQMTRNHQRCGLEGLTITMVDELSNQRSVREGGYPSNALSTTSGCPRDLEDVRQLESPRHQILVYLALLS
jgi:hypothetical protein